MYERLLLMRSGRTMRCCKSCVRWNTRVAAAAANTSVPAVAAGLGRPFTMEAIIWQKSHGAFIMADGDE